MGTSGLDITADFWKVRIRHPGTVELDEFWKASLRYPGIVELADV